MATEDDHLVAVNGRAVECALIGQDLLGLHETQLVDVDFGEPVGEIIVNSP